MTIIDRVRVHASNAPGRVAIEDGERVVSYEELVQSADSMAANLGGLGVAMGDVVAFKLTNTPEQCALMLAIGMRGCVMLPIREDARETEFNHALNSLGVRYFIGDSDDVPLPGGVVGLPLPTLAEAPLERDEDSWQQTVGEDSPYRFSQSSGTTGFPKYFVFTHSYAEQVVSGYREVYGWNHRDRCYLNMPMGDSWGCGISLAMMYLGGTLVIAKQVKATRIVEEINDKGISVLVLLPWQLRVLLRQPYEKIPLLPNVRSLVSSGSRLTGDEKISVWTRISPNYCDIYSASEFPILSIAGRSEHVTHPESVGRPAQGIECQVVDENHKPMAPGSVGLLRFRTSPMFSGYYNNPGADAERLRDGWFYPMDLGYVDEDGYLYLTGRSDDIISCMEAKFYPIEVEKVLLTFPGIEEAVVFGWPDADRGEVAAAALVGPGSGDPAKVMTYCSERLEEYKIPRYYLRLTAIPRNRNGKVDLAILTEKLQQSLDRLDRA